MNCCFRFKVPVPKSTAARGHVWGALRGNNATFPCNVQETAKQSVDRTCTQQDCTHQVCQAWSNLICKAPSAAYGVYTTMLREAQGECTACLMMCILTGLIPPLVLFCVKACCFNLHL